MSETTTEQDPQVLGEEPNAAPQPAEIDAPEGQEQQAEPEQPVEKPKQTPWFQRRIDELTREKHEARRAAEAYAAQLRQIQQGTTGQTAQDAPQPPPGYVPVTEVERAAAAIVQQKAFNEAADAVADEVEKLGEGTLAAAQRTYAMLGGAPPHFLEAVVDLGKEDGARVYAELGANPDEAERILKLSPAKMGIELARMAAKPRVAPVSKAPPPVRPVGSGSTRNQNLETMDDAAFNAEFLKQWNARRYGR